MKYIMILSLLALGACGADGLPLRPDLALGLKIGPNGVTPTANVQTQVGPVGVSLGL